MTEEKEADAIKEINEPNQRDCENYDERNLGIIIESQTEQTRYKHADILSNLLVKSASF